MCQPEVAGDAPHPDRTPRVYLGVPPPEPPGMRVRTPQFEGLSLRDKIGSAHPIEEQVW